MGFIIWYKLEFLEGGPGGLGPLRVSNDIFSGDYVLDADIKLTMDAGSSIDTFHIALINLPGDVADRLATRSAEGLARSFAAPLEVNIFLGYFEDVPLVTATVPVMVGVVTEICTRVDGNGLLITEIKGQERAGYRLRNTYDSPHIDGPSPADKLVDELAKKADVRVAQGPDLNLTLSDYTRRNIPVLQILRELARYAKTPLIVGHNAIHMGPRVGTAAPVVFSPETNLVVHDQGHAAEERAWSALGQAGEGKIARGRFNLVVLGQPQLQLGQPVTLDIADPPTGPIRIQRIAHHFSTTGGRTDIGPGYTCRILAVAASAGAVTTATGGAQAVIDRVADLTEAMQERRPAIDVGEVASYEPAGTGNHSASLHYGQSPAEGALAPSVKTPVDAEPMLHHTPFASPFAWHNCGLVVPVYTGMRALLVHNRGLVDDAVVAGFLWADEPFAARPQNEQGDYWLCLPTEVDADERPTGKGVNDLTTGDGRRVIEAKGLRIAVGMDGLPGVGMRPSVPDDLADSLVIEHQSGTTITVDSDGAVRIETANQEITLTNGGVTLAMRGSAVEVS